MRMRRTGFDPKGHVDCRRYPETLEGDFTVTGSTKLFRVHPQVWGAIHFGDKMDKRFDVGVGTCYASESSIGAYVEVFVHLRPLTRSIVNRYLLAELVVTDDIQVLDLTNSRNLGNRSYAGELQWGHEADYPRCHNLAQAVLKNGLSGIRYYARHDTSASSRSVAIFGRGDSSSTPLSQPDPSSEIFDYLMAAGEELFALEVGKDVTPANPVNFST